MTKKQVVWLAYNLLFVVPITLYLTVNFYWWLFDGNVLNADKMGTSIMVLLCTGTVSAMWADFGDVWRYK